MPKPNDERRKEIMEAALTVFAQKGFRGATNRDIAQAAGIAPGLIYWYFKSKEALYDAIMDEFSPFSDMPLPLDTMTDIPPAQLLPMLVRVIGTIFAESQLTLVVRLLAAESLHDSSEGQRLNALLGKVINPFVTYIRAQVAAGILRDEDPLLMAQMFMSSSALFFIRRVIGQDATLLTYDLEAFAQFVTQAFLRAFGTTSHETGG